MAVKREAENERIVLTGQSKGVKKHNRRAKALLARAGMRGQSVTDSQRPLRHKDPA